MSYKVVAEAGPQLVGLTVGIGFQYMQSYLSIIGSKRHFRNCCILYEYGWCPADTGTNRLEYVFRTWSYSNIYNQVRAVRQFAWHKYPVSELIFSPVPVSRAPLRRIRRIG